MRISDWSSDVCSSDLPSGGVCGRLSLAATGDSVAKSTATRSAWAREFASQQLAPPSCDQDRKSVEEGKSVSVSVDIGGRRSLKKKIGYYITPPRAQEK